MVCSVSAESPGVTETDILKTLDRSPLALNFSSVAVSPSEIAMATSEGLLVLDASLKNGRFLLKDSVTQAAWDPIAARWVAIGPGGAWREDIGWHQPLGSSAAFSEFEALTVTPAGLLFSTKTELWLVQRDRTFHLTTDTGGFFGRPAGTADEVSIIGFWALHRINIKNLPAIESIQIPLPAELRSDIPLGVSYVGRSLIAIGRRAGIYILSAHDRSFSERTAPPSIDAAHAEHGFPEGWIDYASDADELYLLTAACDLFRLSVGQPVRQVSRWPPPASPYRMALMAGRRVLLYPFSGNHVLHADPLSSEIPRKLNFLAAPSGEILVRAGLPPAVFSHRTKWSRAENVAYWILFAALATAVFVWSAVRGVPYLHHFHPHASSYQDRLEKLHRDQSQLVQSLHRMEREIQRMKASASSHHAGDSQISHVGDRIRSLTESRSALQENIHQFIQSVSEEAHRIRAEGLRAGLSGSPPPGLWNRFLRTQTRGWERKFLHLARETEKTIAGGSDV